MFTNRMDAGFALAEKLKKFSGKEGVVLAVPRGGIPIGYVVAKSTGLPLDLLMTKKIGHPQNREYAIGAVSLTDNFLLPHKGVSSTYIKTETQHIRKNLMRMRQKFMGTAEPLPLKDKTVIIVDEFIAVLVPEKFDGVGEFYADFHQVTDDEALYYLGELQAASASPQKPVKPSEIPAPRAGAPPGPSEIPTPEKEISGPHYRK